MASLDRSRRPGLMQPRDWFGVAVRVLGLWMLVECTSALVQAFAASQMAELGTVSNRPTVNYYLSFAVVDFALGLFFLKWPSFFVGLAYGEPEREENDAEVVSASEPPRGNEETEQ